MENLFNNPEVLVVNVQGTTVLHFGKPSFDKLNPSCSH